MTRGRGMWTGRLAIVGLLATGVVGCQALQDALPTKPDPAPAPSQSPVAIPVVLPQPTPTPVLGGPAPSPSPTTSPGPNPTPTAPPPAGGSCNLPPSSNPTDNCTMQSPAFLTAVDKAITLLTEQQPSLFNFNNKICETCYFVKDEAAYGAGVVRNLNAAGYCAHYDGEELGVKNTNSFNEQFDIHISSGHIRRGAGSYRSTCNPAWF